jgi:hypothetical protein
MPRFLAAQAPFLLFIAFVLCLIVYRFIYALDFDSATLSEFLRIDNGVGKDNFGLTYVDDSFKYEKTLLDGGFLSFFHGGTGLDIYSIFARNFSSLVPPTVSIVILNCILTFFIYRRVVSLNHLLLVFFVPYLAMLSSTLNKELYTIYFLLEFPFALSALNLISTKSFSIISLGRFRLKLLDKFAFILFLFSLSCTLFSRPGLLFAVITLFALTSLASSIFSLRISSALLSMIIFFVLSFLILIQFSPQLIKLVTTWTPLSSSAWLDFLSIPINFIYSINAPFPQPLLQLHLLFEYSPLQLYYWFSLLLISIVSVLRLLFCFKRFSSIMRLSSLNTYESYILSLIMLSAYIGFRGEEITRQLVTVAIPSLLLFFLYFRSCKLNGLSFAQK